MAQRTGRDRVGVLLFIMIFHLQPGLDRIQRQKALLLCVDDCKLALQATAHVLAVHGYGVIATDNAKEALCVLQQYAIDAIVADYEMPGMNGAHFAARVKTGPHPTPVLLHSGRADIPATALRHVDAFTPKGQSIDRFLADLDLLLAQKLLPSATDCEPFRLAVLPQ